MVEAKPRGSRWKLTLEQRFWEKVDKSGECWTWTAATTKAGYGKLYVAGKVDGAHRVSWEIHNGPIPAGAFVDHVCFNKACVRPDHLRLATPKQNTEYMKGAHKDSRTGVRGVTYEASRRKYYARVGHKGGQVCVGRFDTLAEAEAAVKAKRAELFTFTEEAA